MTSETEKHEAIQQELNALTILDNGAAMATGTRGDHVVAQQAAGVLRTALLELEGYRGQQDEPPTASENGQRVESETVSDTPV